jgi:ATP:ADP antiporter, AAA family
MALLNRIGRVLPATPQERLAALWSFAYFFTLLAGYYVLRPLRDQMGIAGGVKALPWTFTATFATLLVAQPIYGQLVAKLPRARFIPIVYHFFAFNLVAFWLLLQLGIATVIVARVFFVWVSVFNLFAVAVFWSVMADTFTSEQSKRLFGFIGAGGTAGALLGPVITIGLSVPLGPANLLIAAIVFLELAVFCVHRLESTLETPRDSHPNEQRIGGSAQTRIFATIDLAVGLLTLATQTFATERLLRRLGVGVAAASLPVVYVVGFAALGLTSSLGVVLVFQVLQRWANFAIANPARQVLFTVVSRAEKYMAKNLIDVVIYRGSDALYSWVFDSLQAVGLKLGAIALCALPVVAAWLVLSIALGQTQTRRAERLAEQGG